MKPTIEKIKKLYDKAQSKKNLIKGKLNEIIEYTQEFNTISDTETTGLSIREVDPAISDSIDSLQNFIMSSVFGVKSAWAKFGINQAMLEKDFQGAELLKVQDEAQKSLDKNTTTVFNYLFDSNYYSEVTKSVRDCINLGTGAYVVEKLRSTVMPFTFRYVDLNDLYFLEDSFGNPNQIFHKRYSMTNESIKDNIAGAILPPYGWKGNIISTVTPEFNENTGRTIYHFAVYTDDFKHTIKEETLDYNPYKVFRFSKINGNPWGRGVGIIALNSFKRLAFYKSMRAKQVKRMADPPTMFIGDKRLMYNLSMEAGDKSYGGDGVNKNVQVQNIGVYGNLMPVDQDITTIKQEIRDLYMAKPFGDAEAQEGSKSVEEIQRRFDLFRQRYSGTAELFFEELLKPTFNAPYQILLTNRTISVPKNIDAYVNLRYINELTKASSMDEVNEIVNYMGIIMQTFPNYSPFVFKPSEVIYKIARLMNIDVDLINTKEDIDQGYKQQQAQEQALAMSQLASAQDKGMGDEAGEVAQELTGG